MPDDMWSSENRRRIGLGDMALVELQRSNDRLRDAIVAHRATKLGVTRLRDMRLDAVVDRIIHLDAADLDLWDALYDEDGDDDE